MANSPKIKDSTVAITGGTGSFGSVMAKHLLRKGAAEVRILSRDEAKQDAMRHEIRDSRLNFFLGDVRDSASVNLVLRDATLVFHAAALKQVPSGEFFPIETVKTNVLGSSNVLQSAFEHQVKRVVCLSTDKAVYPINAMGMSKGLMEKTAQAFARQAKDSSTVVAITRYGNVMNSRGSVIPRFFEQMSRGVPLSITHPEMTRFMMSLRESVELVDYAFENAENGDLFVRKAPSTTILNLAQAVARVTGKKLSYEVLGIRHGEKMFESLLSSEEMARAEDLGSFFRVPLDSRDLNYEIYFEEGHGNLDQLESYNSHNTERLDLEEMAAVLLREINEDSGDST